jgi:uncharacterized protein
MAHDVFIDTSGLYAFIVRGDDKHQEASETINRVLGNGRRLVTTDYVIDETATLLKVRGHGHIVSGLFDGILLSRACRIEWMDQEHFDRTKALFLKHSDHEWSFTDCFSFVVMKSAKIEEALTKDKHFREAGFVPLLA